MWEGAVAIKGYYSGMNLPRGEAEMKGEYWLRDARGLRLMTRLIYSIGWGGLFLCLLQCTGGTPRGQAYSPLPPHHESSEEETAVLVSQDKQGPGDIEKQGALLSGKFHTEQRELGAEFEAPSSNNSQKVAVAESVGVEEPLTQTHEKPTSSSEGFLKNAQLLFDAIVVDDVELAMPFFFPKEAYEQVKDIPKPAGDWQRRLKGSFTRDIHAYHRSLGKYRAQTRFLELRVADSLARWVDRGEEVNKLGYYRVLRSVLVYLDKNGRKRELGVLTMISWRGEWYIVHLAPSE